MADFYFDDRKLQKLIKSLGNDIPMARIGILGRTNARNGNGETNATIGTRHEFGLGVPQRSFLRIPVADNIYSAVKKSGLFDKGAIKKVLETGSFLPWIKNLAILGEAVVLEGFATGGYGKWKPSNMARKKIHMTLVETQQLRNSITSEVE